MKSSDEKSFNETKRISIENDLFSELKDSKCAYHVTEEIKGLFSFRSSVISKSIGPF